MLVLVALVIGAVASSGLPSTIAADVSHAAGCVLSGTSCDSSSPAATPRGPFAPGAIAQSKPVGLVEPAKPARLVEPATLVNPRSVKPVDPVAHAANYVANLSTSTARAVGRALLYTGEVSEDLPLPNLVINVLKTVAGKYLKDVGQALLNCANDRDAASCVVSVHTVKVFGFDTGVPDGVVKVYTRPRMFRRR